MRADARAVPLLERLWGDAVQDVVTPPPTPGCDPKYRTLGPAVWAVERLGVNAATIVWSAQPEYEGYQWDGTADPFAVVGQAIANWQDCAVESATGTGKTWFGAICVLWFLDCYPPYQDAEGQWKPGGLVVTTAPKEDQLRLHIWKEIRQQWPKFQKLHPAAELAHLRIRMRPRDDAWAAHGFACGVGADEESATKAQGFHAERMLIITEETPGIHQAVMTAFENTSTWDTNVRLAFGNPDSPNDTLHKFATLKHVKHVRISALDHPNVVTGRPVVVGAVSRKKIDERAVTYGKGSRLYKSRVRGLCPSESADSLIRWSWLEDAVTRYKDLATREACRDKGPPALGVDVANSPNGDKACTVRGKGSCVEEIKPEPCPDANLYGSQTVIPLMRAYDIEPKHVGVDSVGVGAGTVNEMKRLGVKPRSLNGGEKARPLSRREEEFANLRSQMYWQGRLDLEKGEVCMDEDQELFDDLTVPLWTTKNGKIHVESKEDIKKRLGRSPDKGDAWVYWNWVRITRGAASSGGANINI